MKYLIALIISFNLFLVLSAQDENRTEVLNLIVELNTANQDTTKVRVLNKLAEEFIAVDNTKALEYAKKAKNIADKLNLKKDLSLAYYNMAKAFYYQYKFDSIIYYYNESKPINELELNWQVYANYASLMGMVEHIQSNYSKAIIYYNESLELNKKLNNIEGMAHSYNNIGAAFYNLGDFEKALDNYFASLPINEEIGNLRLVATTLANIGAIYEEQEKYDDALLNFKKANKIALEGGLKQTIADTYRNLGGIYTEKNKIDSTIIVYSKALELYRELNDLRGIVVVNNLFGQTYVKSFEYGKSDEEQKKLKKALEYYTKSLDLNNKELDEVEEKIISYQGIGEIFIFKKQYTKAITYLSKAKEMAEEIEWVAYIKEAHNFLSLAYSGIGNYRLAYENHVLYKNWNDSLKNDENVELLTKMSMQHEFDKQQKEQEFIQAQKDLEYEQKRKRDRLIRIFILAGLAIVSVFSIQMFRSYKRKIKDNILLEKQKTEIEKQKEEITDSIKYAKRIQSAILPSINWASDNLPENFILFRPRDIVSGDYYWMNKIDNKIVLVAADCTGHGVPGAFMSMLGVSFLNEIVSNNNTIQPSLILNQLRKKVKETLDQTGKEGEAKDGMDIALCVIDLDTMMLQYAGAYNPLYLFRNGELLETKADKMPIGIYIREKESFTNHEIQLQKGDTFYIFSDGYADQFGGPNGSKFKSRPFKLLLEKIQPQSMAQQRETLNTTIDEWRGDIDQIDDIIILGVRV